MQPLVRRARAEDEHAIMEILWGDPSSEAAALTGSTERARQFGRLVAAVSPVPLWRSCVVAEVEGEVGGLLQQGTEQFSPNVRFLRALVRTWGLRRCLGLLPRGLALQRVRIPTPRDSWVVLEVHVRPNLRNRGLGRLLLAEAEQAAREAGFARIALTTRTNNPAVRLYERVGYRIVRRRTSPTYRRWTGADGRVLMVKELPA